MALIPLFLKRLWPWGRRRAKRPDPAPPAAAVPEAREEPIPAPAPAEPEPMPSAPAPAAAEPPLPIEPVPTAPLIANDLEHWGDGELADEDVDEDLDEDEDLDDPAEPDPFVSVDRPPIALEPIETLEERRRDARARGLAGEHRVHLSDAAGPGSLAEALNELLEEGRVMAEFREDGEETPYLLYRPLS
jgi:hypothetical protein